MDTLIRICIRVVILYLYSNYSFLLLINKCGLIFKGITFHQLLIKPFFTEFFPSVS